MVIQDQQGTGDFGYMSRDSFVVFASYMKSFSKLTMEQRGVLITAMMAYQMGEKLPDMDALTDMAFSFIKDDMDFNNQKYDEMCERNKQNGKKGGRPKASGLSENPKNPSGFSENPTKPTETLYEYDYESDYESESVKETKQRKFVKPSVDDVRAYCEERQNNVDPDAFVNFYESKGWKVGSNAMKDWKAAIRTWEKRSDKPVTNKSSPNKPYEIPKDQHSKIHNYNERQVDYSTFEDFINA